MKKINFKFPRRNYLVKNKNKKIVIASIIGIILVIGSIVLYKSYAFYKEEKIYNILQGKVPEFNYDLKLAVTLDGEKVESIPVKEENVYYQVNVTCNEGTGKWNYTKWLVEVSDFSSNTKCNVAFTKTEEEIKIPEENTNTQITKNESIAVPEGTTKAYLVWKAITTYNCDVPTISTTGIVKSVKRIKQDVYTETGVRALCDYMYEIDLTGEEGVLALSGISGGSGTRTNNYYFIIGEFQKQISNFLN